MTAIVALSGSPSNPSRSAWLLQRALRVLDEPHAGGAIVHLRELPPGALLAADRDAAPVRRALERVAAARTVLIATPIYKAAYSGLLKVFLDLLPADGLHGKTVLPLATGGSLAHWLAVDYALKPVLAALGARDIAGGVFATDEQLPPDGAGGYRPHPALDERLRIALAPFAVERCSSG